ncbi:MAG: ion transporter [Flavobacteriales bacterium]
MQKWRQNIHDVIFEADTRSGKLFDIMLLVFILASLLVIMLDSVVSIHKEYLNLLLGLEWFFTIVFTIEYVLRIISVKNPIKYMISFYGIIDFVSTIPSYLTLFMPGGGHVFKVLRVLRFLRLFKVFKLGRFTTEGKMLGQALKESKEKIIVFLVAVLCMAMILGSVMYVVEGGDNGFTSIPRSIYWAIVTLTTVGFGDISPVTPLGQLISSVIMILGYGIIAVPTGMVTAGVVKRNLTYTNTQHCSNCSKEGHADDAKFCKFCGENL